MITKYATFSGKTPSGNPLIHLVEPGSAYGMNKTAGIDKTASGEHMPQVQELLEAIAPQPGRLYLVNSALGAGEYVGFNLRGDWFTEAGLTREPPGWNDIPVWDIDARRKAANITENLGQWGDLTWGYPTFYNAHRFRHHVNKDPNKAYGFILGAFWDDRMKRVILVSELVEDMCRSLGAMDLYRRIENGEFPDSSMGSKVPYDRCAICGNKARNPSEYCQHVSPKAMPPFGMGRLLPDGRRCGVYNDQPRFFDDSFVFTGAERSAKVMANVTDMVKGNNPYTQTIYPFSINALNKAASNDDDAIVTNASSTDPALDTKIDIAIRQLPVSSPMERAALRYYADVIRAGNRVKDGNLSSQEFIAITAQMKYLFMQQYKVPVESMVHTKDQLLTALRHMLAAENKAPSEKSASFYKWATLFKEIPSDPKYVSIAQSQSKGMRPLPDEVLGLAKQDPNGILGQLGRLGIVMTPPEFQDVMLSNSNPDLASAVKVTKVTFAPQPMDDSPIGAGFPIPMGVSSLLKSLIGDSLIENRSFSPSAVRIRIIKNTLPIPENSEYTTIDHPELNQIGQLYNTYRFGLLKNMGDIDKIVTHLPPSSDIMTDIGLEKDASSVSKLLFSTGYWKFL